MITCTLDGKTYFVDCITGRALREIGPALDMYGKIMSISGKLEKGEEPYSAALRELREETGGLADKLEYLGAYYGSAGFCDEKLDLYFARLDSTGAADPDEDEFLTVERYPLADFEAMIARGEIADGKTLSAYTLARAAGWI